MSVCDVITSWYVGCYLFFKSNLNFTTNSNSIGFLGWEEKLYFFVRKMKKKVNYMKNKISN